MLEVRERRVCIATSIHPDFDARIYRHVRAVAAMGYEVDFVSPWKPDMERMPRNVRMISFPRVLKRWQRPYIYAQMLPLLLKERYALYHFHDLDVLPLFAALKLATGRPVVYDCHENYPEEMLIREYIPPVLRKSLSVAVRWGERAAAAAIRDVVIVVPHMQQQFPKPLYRTVLVRNFAAPGLERHRKDDYLSRAPACISIASQYVANGALVFLDILKIVVKRHPEVKFYAVDRFDGSSDLRAKILEIVEREKLGKNFELLPQVLPPDIMQHLNRATVAISANLAVPTQVTGLPTKLCEYMAAGVPVVASNFPTGRELIEGTGCGFMATPGDPQSFADAVCKLIEDKQAAYEMGQRGLAAFREQFNWDAEVAKVGELYKRLLARQPS